MEINEILKETIDNLKKVTDTESVIGKPIISQDGTVVLPVVKLSAGYVLGGGNGKNQSNADKVPCAGVGGGGVTVTPVGFLLCGREKRFISVDKTTDSKWAELLKTAVNTFRSDSDE